MWPYLLAGASTLLGMQANRRAGKYEVEAGSQDMTDALLSGHFREEAISEKRDRILSSTRARAAASGVEMTGSPLEVLLESSKQAQRDLFISRYTTERNVNKARTRITRGADAEASGPLEGLLSFGKEFFDIQAREAAAYKKPTGGDMFSSWGADQWGG